MSELRHWLGIVPVKDGEGKIVRWIPKLAIPGLKTESEAIAIARSALGPNAGIRERAW
jgi:hypothetical protein